MAPTVHHLRRAQLLPLAPEDAYAYFSDPRHLPEITPAWLRFSVTTPPPGGIVAGSQINYTLRWLGLPLRWTTLITECERSSRSERSGPVLRFVDTQLRGPYHRWWHEHRFVAIGEDTLMTDHIEYEMPFGLIGALFQPLIHRQLRGILDERTRITSALFPHPALDTRATTAHDLPEPIPPSEGDAC